MATDLQVTIDDGATSVVPGTNNTYTITVTNNGPDTVSDLTLTDTIPAALLSPTTFGVPSQGSYNPTTGDWSGLTLASGQSVTITVSGTIDPNATGSITNTVTVSPPAGETDSNPANDSATDTDTCVPKADLAVTKTVSDATPNVGDTITYTVTLSDNGPSTATSVRVTDLLPAGVTFVSATPSQGAYISTTGLWTVGTVRTFAPQTLTITGTVNSPTAQTNTATISNSDQPDLITANNSASATETPQQADLAVTKSVSNATPNVGDTITYTVTLSDIGPNAATNVQLTDLLPAGVTFTGATPSQGTYVSSTGLWTVGTVSTGTPQTLTITGTVISPTAQTNTASVSHADQFDPTTANNSASATETPQQADLAVTKTVSNATPNVGDTITFTVTLSDNGPDAATNVLLTDLLPTGVTFASDTTSEGTYDSATGLWTVGTVNSGTPQTLTITGTVNSPSSQTNTASISHADQFDPNTANNSASATETPQADLGVTKTVSNLTPNVGDTITYTITLADSSVGAATNVQVADLLPTGVTFVSATPSQGTYVSGTGLWTVGTVLPGVPLTLTITGTVNSPSSQTNSASISHADQFDPNTVNNTASATETPQQADLVVTKTVSTPTANVGDSVTFTVTLSDSGPDAATNVDVSDLLPTGVTFVSDTASQGTYDNTTGQWTVGTVNSGTPETLTITGTVNSAGPQPNTATISHADQFDPDTANNSATATLDAASPTLSTSPIPTTVLLGPTPPTLTDTATLAGGFSPTGTITFTLFYNGGSTPVDTESVTVTGNGAYTTPTGFTFPSSGAASGTYQWDATYGGDIDNNVATDLSNPTELVSVSSAVTTLFTIPNPNIVLLNPAVSPLKDTATLSGGFNPTGTITFTLFYNGGVTPVDAETVTVNGNGTYTTPTGFTLPGGGPVTGTYQWDATYTGDTNNGGSSDVTNPSEQVTVVAAVPTLSTTPTPPAVLLGPTPSLLTDSANLTGGFDPTGTITFTLFYNGGSTPVDTETVTVNGNGTYTTPTGFTLPGNGMVTGIYQWDAIYTGDTNNGSASDVSNPTELVTVSPAVPTLSTTPSLAAVTLGPTFPTLKDTAVLAAGFNPTGTITFTLVAPGGTTVDTETVTVSGDGTYTTPSGFTLSSGDATGTYQWNALYTGDISNNAASDTNSPTERVTVAPGAAPVVPTLSTTPGQATVSLVPTPPTLTDTATLAGGSNPTGTITFTLFGPGGTTPLDTETVTVNGNGSYTTPTGFSLPSGAATGTYQWDASYSGDAGNTAVSDINDATEQVTVRASRVTPGDFSGAGMSGVLWRQATTQLFVQWSMSGPVITASQLNTFLGTPVLPDASWTELGTADFGGDGKTDVLWRHSSDSTLTVWSMNGSVITDGGFVTSQGQAVHVGTSWSLAGTGDFDGDGKADMLWRNSNGSLAEWLMNGTTVTSSQAPTFQGQAISPDQSWNVVAMGDFNGDGRQDILWRNSSGTLQEWLMNGSTITSSQAPTFQGSAVSPDASWSIIAAGDFNGDGMTDLLWRQSGTGSLMEWQMNGSQIASSQAVLFQGQPLKTPDPSWSLVEIGDFNGDGNSDALWRQSTTGALSEWLMNGSQIASSSPVTSQSVNPSLDASWQVQGKPTNFA